jgi:hypothetical protein
MKLSHIRSLRWRTRFTPETASFVCLPLGIYPIKATSDTRPKVSI